MSRHLRRFDSYHDFIDYTNRGSDMPSRTRDSRSTTSFSFTDNPTKDFDEANEVARFGWRDKSASVTKLVNEIQHDLQPLMQSTFTSYFDVTGGTVDIDRFLMGEPENMLESLPITVAKPGKVITILVNCGFSCHVKGEPIITRGTAICGLVDCLNLMQHGVEVWAEIPIYSGPGIGKGSVISYLVKIKGTDELLDISRVLYGLAHPSFLRRHIFSALETEPPSIRGEFSVGFNYGYPGPLTASAEIGATLSLDLLQRDDPTGRDAEGWIRDNLSEWGLLV